MDSRKANRKFASVNSGKKLSPIPGSTPRLQSEATFKTPATDLIPAKIEHVKGVLYCRFEGFLKAKNDSMTLASPSDNITLELDAFPEAFHAASTPSTLSMLSHSSEVESVLEWSMNSSYPLTWSPQQRKASYIKLSLYQQDGRYKGNGPKKFIAMTSVDLPSILTSTDRSYLCCLPLYPPGSFYHTDSILGWVCVGFKFALTDNVTTDLQTEVQTFWRKVLSLDTSIHHALLDLPINPDVLRPSEKILITDPPTTSYTVHMALGELSLTLMAQRLLTTSMQINGGATATTVLDTDLEKDATALAATTATTSSPRLFQAEIRLSTNYEVVSTVIGEYNMATGSIQWSPADLVLPTQALADSSVLLDITLRYANGETKRPRLTMPVAAATSSVSLGVFTTKFAYCNVCISWAQLSAGRPVNISVPMRDQEDIRIGNIAMSIHSSALQLPSSSANALTIGPTSSLMASTTATSTISTLSSSTTKYFLLVEYVEGHISQETGGSANLPASSATTNDLDNTVNPTAHVTSAALYSASDVFFESLLLVHPEHPGSTGRKQHQQYQDAQKRKSRSGFIPSHRIQQWSLASRILIPPDVSQYLSKVRIWDAVSVGIIVRTSAYPGCPELGRARVALPNQLFQEYAANKPRNVEQFVTFYSYEPQTQYYPMSAVPELKKQFAGRVRIRISLQRESYMPLYKAIVEKVSSLNKPLSPRTIRPQLKWSHGLGAVMVRLLGINSSRQAHDDCFDERILFASMTKSMPSVSYASSSSTTSWDPFVDVVNDRVILHQESYSQFMLPNPAAAAPSEDYHNVLSTSSVVGGTKVFSSATNVHVELRSETGLSTLATQFPASKAIPRSPSLSGGLSPSTNIYNSPSIQSVTPEFIINLTKKSLKQTAVRVSTLMDGNDDGLSSSSPLPQYQQQQQSASRSLMDAKLKLQACLVPYIEGSLMIQLATPAFASAAVANLPALQPPHVHTTPLMARLSLGGTSTHFADALLPMPPSAATSSSATTTTATLRVNTFELLHHRSNSGSNGNGNGNGNGDATDSEDFGGGMLPLMIDVFTDLAVSLASTSQVAQTVWTHADKEPVLIGAMDTAPVYLVALRALLSASSSTSSPSPSSPAPPVAAAATVAPAPETTLSRSNRRNGGPTASTSVPGNVNNRGGNADSSSSSSASSSSPDLVWLSTTVDLYRPSTIASSSRKQVVGRLPVRIAFRPESVPFFVADMLQSLLYPPLNLLTIGSTAAAALRFNETISAGTTADPTSGSSSEEERLRIELGLKQAFVAADTDGSGAISATELIAVIQAGSMGTTIGSAVGGATSSSSTSALSAATAMTTSNKTAPRLGLENTSQLLHTLAQLSDSTNGGGSSSRNPFAASTSRNSSVRMRLPSTQLLTSASTPALPPPSSTTQGGLTSASTSRLPLVGATTTAMSTSNQVYDITRLFRQLDLDGDGTITWCEWQSVLTIALQWQQLQQWQHQQRRQWRRLQRAQSSSTRRSITNVGPQTDDTLNGHNNEDEEDGEEDGVEDAIDDEETRLLARTINLLDPLFVLFVASTALLPTASPLTPYPEELPLRIPVSSVTNGQSDETDWEDAFSVMPKQYANTAEPAITTTSTTVLDQPFDGRAGNAADSSSTLPLLPSSKVSARLNHLVQSLRLTNSLVAQRVDSTALTTAFHDPANEGSGNVGGPVAGYDHQQQQQQQDRHEQQTQLYVRAFRKEHHHAQALRNEVLSLQAEVDQLKAHQPDGTEGMTNSSKATTARIEQSVTEITAVIAERLAQLEQRKRQQEQQARAQRTLTTFLTRYALPRQHARREAMARQRLLHWMTIHLRRRHFRDHLAQKQQAAVTIQQRLRGLLVRQQWRLQLHMATRLQRLFRGFRARREAAQRRRHREQVDAFRKARAMRLIARVWRVFHQRRVDQATRVIGDSVHRYYLRRQARAQLESLRQQRLRATRLLACIVRIQRTFRRWRLRRYARQELIRRRVKRDFYQNRAQLIAWPSAKKPALADVVGFWIADVSSLLSLHPHPTAMLSVTGAPNNTTANGTVTPPPGGPIGMVATASVADIDVKDVVVPEHLFMRIDKVDLSMRVCTVSFIPQQHNADITPELQTTVIAYDHPNMTWYALQEPPKDETPDHHHHHHHNKHEEPAAPTTAVDASSVSSEESVVSEESEESVVELSQRDLLLAAHLQLLLHKAVMYSPDGGEMASRFGTVTAFNLASRSIGIEFQSPANVAATTATSAAASTGANHAITAVSTAGSSAAVPVGGVGHSAASSAAVTGTTSSSTEWLAYDHPYLLWLQADGSWHPIVFNINGTATPSGGFTPGMNTAAASHYALGAASNHPNNATASAAAATAASAVVSMNNTGTEPSGRSSGAHTPNNVLGSTPSHGKSMHRLAAGAMGTGHVSGPGTVSPPRRVVVATPAASSTATGTPSAVSKHGGSHKTPHGHAHGHGHGHGHNSNSDNHHAPATAAKPASSSKKHRAHASPSEK